MKKVMLVALLLGISLVVGHAQTVTAVDAADGVSLSQVSPPGATRDVGDWIYDIDVGGATNDIRCLGVEFDDTHWWITGAKDMTGGFLYRLDYAGTLLNSYATGHTGWGWRDIAYDGTYLYASDSYVIEQIDPGTGAATGVVIQSPISPARALAYDSARDLFWTGNFSSDIFSITRTGVATQYGTILGGTYGAAYDAPTDMVWIWDQTSGSGVNAHEFDPAAGTWTGNTWDGTTGVDSLAGGCCIFDDLTHGHVFAGLQQVINGDDIVSVYEFEDSPLPQLDIQCNGQDSGVNLTPTQKAYLTINVEARSGAGAPIDLWVVIRRVGGFAYCYNGSWHQGLGFPAHSGGLFDITDKTVLSRTLPVGSYIAYLALDTNMNGVLDMGSIAIVDSVDITVQ